MKIIGKLYLLVIKIYDRILMFCLLPLFKTHGNNIRFFPTKSSFSYSTIKLGNDVFIGPGASFSSIVSIVIGDKIMFGPNVTIIGGDHRFDLIGKYMYDIKEKGPTDDIPVIIESDVWIGANVVILKGVCVGRGAIIAAGSLVTKSLPPYSISVGIPAKPIKLRWNIIEIVKHEEQLYSFEERLSEDYLINTYKKLNLL